MMLHPQVKLNKFLSLEGVILYSFIGFLDIFIMYHVSCILCYVSCILSEYILRIGDILHPLANSTLNNHLQPYI